MNDLEKKIRRFTGMSFLSKTKKIRDKTIAAFVPNYIKIKWKSKKKDYFGVNTEKRDVPLIVSLTTYPGRIKGVHLVIESLLCQTVKPDMIILWLASEQFPKKEKDLPIELLNLKKYGLTIDWYHDIGSYKKLIPTYKKFPNSFIMTFDDDQYYLPSTIERLYKEAIKNPNEIHCHRGTKIVVYNNKFSLIPGGYITYSKPTFLHKLTGCCGVCYPPNTLYKDLTNEKLFMKLAPTNDDIWFWLMGVLRGTKCNIIKNNLPGLFTIKNSQHESLSSINDKDECLFWRDFNAVMDYYPNLRNVLKKEYKEIIGK